MEDIFKLKNLNNVFNVVWFDLFWILKTFYEQPLGVKYGDQFWRVSKKIVSF